MGVAAGERPVADFSLMNTALRVRIVEVVVI
jgi:hypothetical protein